MSGGANPWFGSNGNMAAQKATGSNRSQRSNMSTRYEAASECTR